MQSILVLSEKDVEIAVSRELMFKTMSQAFIDFSSGQAEIFPVAVGEGAQDGTMVAIKGGVTKRDGFVGVKIGTYWAENLKRGLPNHGATTLLLSPETGLPFAVVNVRVLNSLRTAAANAVAVKALSREDSSVLSVIGAGHQARQDVRAICDVRDIRKIVVWNRTRDRAAKFAQLISGESGIETEVVESAENAAEQGDILTSATIATAPILDMSAVRPGTHISAMGADRKGKMEWNPELIVVAKLFADSPDQSVEIGEFQHAFSAGLISKSDINSLGDILRGVAPGRTSDSEITIFDSSGIAVQDVAAARSAVEAAKTSGSFSKILF